ncbi:MAG: sigma-70 family RNA polymerase sigma factor [Bacteroidetes bacterium]|nr:sigma-70 family RNA polymerase sigma factor [Bacteroidota bacterium]
MTDMELIQRAVKLNDQTAFSELMKRYREPIRVFLIRLVQNLDDAEDLTNLSFEKAFRNLPNYRPDFTFSTWLFTIAKNTAIDFGRKRTLPTQPLQPKLEHPDRIREFPIPDQDLNPEQNLIRDQKHAEIRALVADLKPDFKIVVELFYFEGLSIEEIAEKTKRPTGTVKANLSRARVALQQKLTRSRPQ